MGRAVNPNRPIQAIHLTLRSLVFLSLYVCVCVQISEEEIERIMSGQEFEGEPNISWCNNGDSDNSSPGNGVSESNQPSPVSTPSSRWDSAEGSPGFVGQGDRRGGEAFRSVEGLSSPSLLSQPCLASSSRSVEMNGFTVLRDQYMGTPVSAPYQYLPHLLSCPTHTALLPPQPRSLDPQAHGLLISQLVSAEDQEPLGTPMLIEDG